MLGLLLHELAAAESRLRVDEFVRTECSSALLALIAICTLSTAAWASACDVAVSKEGLCLLVIVLLACLLNKLALIVKFLEEIRCVLVVSI